MLQGLASKVLLYLIASWGISSSPIPVITLHDSHVYNNVFSLDLSTNSRLTYPTMTAQYLHVDVLMVFQTFPVQSLILDFHISPPPNLIFQEVFHLTKWQLSPSIYLGHSYLVTVLKVACRAILAVSCLHSFPTIPFLVQYPSVTLASCSLEIANTHSPQDVLAIASAGSISPSDTHLLFHFLPLLPCMCPVLLTLPYCGPQHWSPLPHN